jgi:hypothetical protein
MEKRRVATRKQLKRTVLTAVFEAPRGLVNIKDLVDGPEDRWQHLRKEINTRRVEAPFAPIANQSISGFNLMDQAFKGRHQFLPTFQAASSHALGTTEARLRQMIRAPHNIADIKSQRATSGFARPLPSF